MKWLALHVGGQKWAVHLVPPSNKYLLDGEEKHVGRCVFEKCAIYIARNLDAPAREDVLLHELLHASLYVSGGEAVYNRNAEKEEQLVAALTPVLHRLLSDLGFVFPKAS